VPRGVWRCGVARDTGTRAVQPYALVVRSQTGDLSYSSSAARKHWGMLVKCMDTLGGAWARLRGLRPISLTTLCLAAATKLAPSRGATLGVLDGVRQLTQAAPAHRKRSRVAYGSADDSSSGSASDDEDTSDDDQSSDTSSDADSKARTRRRAGRGGATKRRRQRHRGSESGSGEGSDGSGNRVSEQKVSAEERARAMWDPQAGPQWMLPSPDASALKRRMHATAAELLCKVYDHRRLHRVQRVAEVQKRAQGVFQKLDASCEELGVPRLTQTNDVCHRLHSLERTAPTLWFCVCGCVCVCAEPQEGLPPIRARQRECAVSRDRGDMHWRWIFRHRCG